MRDNEPLDDFDWIDFWPDLQARRPHGDECETRRKQEQETLADRRSKEKPTQHHTKTTMFVRRRRRAR